MSEREKRPIIVKKVIKQEAGHHGGAWKVAYADFVTAMMAFFLLMWLLNATSEEQRKGIADYFDPTLPISRTSSGGIALLSGESIFADSPLAGMKDRGVKRRPGDPEPVPGEATPTEGGAYDRVTGQGDGPESAETRPAADTNRTDTAGTDPAEGALGAELEAAIETLDDPALREHFRLRVTPEGLSIEIVDLSDEPLFEGGSARPSPVLELLLGVLVPILATTENDLAVLGHTDARPFRVGARYSNWELSADRANAARRLLSRLGLGEDRIARVSGMAATQPFAADPAAAENRRISLVVLREGRR